ncbi:hypothetical protein CVT26_013983 [Gymnopilus dilepis]|uniref:RING-type domain-containing protein n=1 Tax=Gymnopilus dilepis TaxID=231916 RepID=A0A409VW91_9AGAR|nr:hypothetical protein CVT26_013983 [Gymnopilus dilepis]
MPATRSSSMQPRPQPFPSSDKHISLTDSDSDLPRSPLRPMRQNSAKPRSTARPKKPFLPPPEEIIEISSDEDEETRSTVPQAHVVADFRRQISKLREENVKCKRDLERASKQLKELKEENQTLQALHKPDKATISLDVEQLSDHLDCEICTSRMWTPYILPDCGHTFCQSCLQDWFGTVQAKFLTDHPQNDPQRNAATLGHLNLFIAQNPQVALRPDLLNMISRSLPPQPKYTCPTCRELVRSRPTEAFALKAIVRTIATAAGETSPQKPARSIGAASNPWDGFFPRNLT